MWWGLGIAGAVLALCCGAGVVAVGGLAVTGVQAVNEQAQQAVGEYLDAASEGNWRAAYEQRCARDRRAESPSEFTERVSDLPRIESYDLEEAEITPAGDVHVPATVDYVDSGTENLNVPVAQNTRTGELEVCGFRR